MTYRVFLSLCLSCGLAVPVIAQQASGSNDQSGTSQAAPAIQSEREPLTVPKPRNFWDGDEPSVFSLILHPMATKAYVRRLTVPIKDRLNELEQINAEQKAMATGIDSRTTQGLQLASEKTTLADQHATDALTKAQSAQTVATQASTRVESAEKMVGGVDQFKGGAQTEIMFRRGQTVLSKSAKDALDQMAAPLKGQNNYVVEVRGFAPGSGSAAIASSQKMADSVVRYLVETQNIPMYRIARVGMGNAAGDSGKRVSSPRVEVNVMKNDLLNTAQR